MKLHKVGLLVFLLAGTVTAASSQETPVAGKTAGVKASDFKPPFQPANSACMTGDRGPWRQRCGTR